MTTAVRMPAAERRQALIDTAIKVFSEGSYHGTTTAEIARAAGISEPILYRHFASKRELYLAALDHVWGNARASWEHALATTDAVRGVLDGVVQPDLFDKPGAPMFCDQHGRSRWRLRCSRRRDIPT